MEKNNTKNRLIESAYNEIHENGYQGASLNTILKNAKVHKGSMYHFFSTKKEMALCAIQEKVYAKFEQRYASILDLDSGYLEALITELRDTSQRDFIRGCPIANIVQEMSNIDKDFKLIMEKIYFTFRKSIKNILDIAIEKEEMKECDTSNLALYIASTLEGAILSAKATGNVQDYSGVIDMLAIFILSFKIKLTYIAKS